METPRNILRRAEAQRRPPLSAPVRPTPVAPQHVAAVDAPAERPQRVAAPQPIRTNSVYRQLMRSHDRMHTQHLQG